MKTRLILAAALAAGAVTAVPLAASADHDDRITIGARLDFTSQTHADGTFAVCCSITDAGSASADITSYQPRGSRANFTATNRFVGANGTFVIALEGATGPLGSPVHVAQARWRVISGTGAYEHLRAHGRLSAVTNQQTGALTAIDVGEIAGGS
ncbi:MAG: hypothetical protein QOI64_1261 [Solirubrobacteraceae bacterium]|jgi:hypothetical protein|nr:hypothetical protein [Solirubrobacteraceae bacterium]